MYYSREGNSLNVSCRGKGNAVLIKSGFHYPNNGSVNSMLSFMKLLNPPQNKIDIRPIERLCCGQTLLCKLLEITVKEGDQQQFDPNRFYLKDVHYVPKKIIQTTRRRIPEGSD